MKVACPSCAAEYPVDERKLPAAGLKMRCPKCGGRFGVFPDGRTEDASGPRAFAKPKDSAGAAPKPPVPRPRPSVPKPGLELDADLPAPKKRSPSPRGLFGDDADLPAPKKPRGASGRAPLAPPVAKPRAPLAPPVTKPRAPLAPPVGDLDLDLPAPKRSAPAAPDLDLDLPAPRPRAPAGAAKSPLSDLDLDLPAPKAARARIAPPVTDDLDLDLPAPKAARARIAPPVPDDLDLPAPKRAARPDRGVDLPVAAAAAGVASAGASRSKGVFDDLDLPTPSQSADLPKIAGNEFDLDLPTPKTDDLDLDLPTPRSALASEGTPFDDLGVDLPKAKRPSVIEEADAAFGDLDLPMPKRSAGESTGGFGDLDLPMPKGASDLPAPKQPDAFGGLDLPEPRSDLPALAGGFGDLDLPMPAGVSDLPGPTQEVADLPVAMGEADLPMPAADREPFDDLALPEPRELPAPDLELDDEAMRDKDGRAGVGGTAFGELDLGDAAETDDMEFADLPPEQEVADSPHPIEGATGAAAAAPAAAKPVAKTRGAKAPAKPKKKSRAVAIVAGVLGVLVAAGVGLGWTPYGFFGMYLADAYLPGAGDEAQVRRAIAQAESQAQSDVWVDVRTSLSTLSEVRRGAGLNRTLLARSLVHECLFEVRFHDPSYGSGARASSIESRLQERGAEGPELALARAAVALRERGSNTTISAAIRQARAHDGSDPYVGLVAGEAALIAGDSATALAEFESAEQNGGAARALWGIARARLRMDDPTAARAAVEAVLRASEGHAEARIALAEMQLGELELETAVRGAREAIGELPLGDATEVVRPSPHARAAGWTVIGQVQERRGRSTRALAAFERALRDDDAHVPALLGAGRVLLADRPSDALARFEPILQAQGAQGLVVASGRTAVQEARLGAARAHLRLDSVSEAQTNLAALATELGDDPEVLLYLGHAERAQDPPNNEAAEQHYRAAIEAARESLPAYVALAQLFLATDRASDAGAVIEQATARVPESGEMRYQLGRFELARNRLPAAIRELNRALALDPALPGALYQLGVAQRRSRQLNAAVATFERLAQIDPAHPGLAVERGRLFEARGESGRAVEAYVAALEDDPDNMDLLLRLGAAQVISGDIDDAEETLARVRQARPNSPEAQHFVGRVAFARGRFAEALDHFRQAVRLDPARAEFHLYVAWAALETNSNLGEALGAVEEALEREPEMGKAFWIRGEVRLRSGQPREALADLEQARTADPQLDAVYAALGEAHDQLRNLPAAISSYETAVTRDDDNGRWYYRLGRLRLDAGRPADAAQALARATLLGDADASTPGWLAEAHRLQADSLRASGSRAESVPHYRRFLELAPRNSIDRPEVRQTLMDMDEVPPPE